MTSNISNIEKQAIGEIKQAKSENELESLRVKYCGRKGTITGLLRSLSDVPAKERPGQGARINRLKKVVEKAIDDKIAAQSSRKLSNLDKSDRIDVTMPGIMPEVGHLHPITQIMDELIEIFVGMGYHVAEGPEIETDWYNFQALNIPPEHPARDMQDTFYIEEGKILPRTHTSPVQVRYMEQNKPPIRIIAPGKVYRNEDEGPRHSWMFHQLEGLVVDEGVTLGDLKGTLQVMMEGILGKGTKIRLRPNYFPYTEPSCEMDATCFMCKGKGCRVCDQTGWLELGGAGMVHPKVFENVGIDPEKYTGFAFGFGPQRMALIKYGVSDIRQFWRPDLRFLEQF